MRVAPPRLEFQAGFGFTEMLFQSALWTDTRMRWSPRITVLVGLLAGLAGWVVFDDAGVQPDRVSVGEPQREAAKPERGGLAARPPEIPPRAALQALRADPFSPHSWQTAAKPGAAARGVAPAPSAPPLPYRFVGRLYQNGATQVFFGKGDTVLAARQGDTLDGQYRVDSVSDGEVTLVYLPMGTLYKFPLDALLREAERATATTQPVQLRWDSSLSVR